MNHDQVRMTSQGMSNQVTACLIPVAVDTEHGRWAARAAVSPTHGP
jgi:hypothetical protein